MKHPFASCGLADSREDIIPNFPHQIFLFDSTLAQEVNLNSYAYATQLHTTSHSNDIVLVLKEKSRFLGHVRVRSSPLLPSTRLSVSERF